MSPDVEPLKIYGRGGPNPAKVQILLASLSLPVENISTPYSTIKSPPYLAINPNGRLPALHDPNFTSNSSSTGITIWESGAIIEYLVERYDTQHHLSFPPGTTEFYHAKQWLFFQTTGQGPYFGQAAWFKKFHHEQIPSALERYVKEVNRVTGVLETYLSQQVKGHDGPWLVGGKCSYADLAFYPWQKIIAVLLAGDGEYSEDHFPHVKDWLARMAGREGVKAVPLAAGE